MGVTLKKFMKHILIEKSEKIDQIISKITEDDVSKRFDVENTLNSIDLINKE